MIDRLKMSACFDRLKQMIANISILLFSTLCIVYLGGILYAYTVSDKLIFPMLSPTYEDSSEILKLRTGHHDTISALHLEASGSKELLLYSHGNGEDLGDIRPLLDEFQRRGVSVFAYDYPGYGTSTGHPTEAGVYAAAETAYIYATETLGYAPAAITLYGRSLGSGPSCWLAERYPVSGLILDGAFSSTFRVMTRVKILPWDKFDNLARLPAMKCPVLLAHGTEDLTVPFTHALQNSSAIRSKKYTLWVEGAGHNDLIERAGPAYWDAVLPFIQNEL